MFVSSMRTSPASSPVISLLGPNGGTVGVTSGNFTVTLNNPKGGSVVVTPSSNGGGGSFTPTSVTLSNGSPTATFVYTPATAGAKTISISNNRSFGQIGSPIIYTATAVVATAFTLTGATTGTTGSAVTYTVTPNNTMGSTVVVTPAASNGGVVAPSTLTFTSGSSAAQTFTVTRSTDGTSSVSITNNGGLTNSGSPISLTTSTASATNLVNITLTSATGAGTHPFMFAQVFPEGATTTAALNLADSEYVARVLATWPGGSAKHAVFMGETTFTGSSKVLTITNGSGGAGGSDLTHANIVSAAPTATVQCGGLGTVSLATLLAAGPERTVQSNPKMVECHYVQQVGSTDILVWFHVRYWASGRMWVWAQVENGYFDNGASGIDIATNLTLAPVNIVINGVNVYTNSSLNLWQFATFGAEGWIGTNPQITLAHDTSYLRNTKLVPNYAWRNPSTTTLNALTQTYTPMSVGMHDNLMGIGGGAGDVNGEIGIIPNWEALYCTSADIRAYKATIANCLAMNTYCMTRRDRTTKRVPRISNFGTWTVWGPAGGPNGGGNGQNEWPQFQDAVIPNYWEQAHHPSTGYTPYMLTGDYRFYELMQKTAFMCWAMQPSTAGTGTNRGFFNQQTRTAAWCLRTVGQLCAIAPDADFSGATIMADFRALLASNYAQLATLTASGTSAWCGGLWFQPYGQWDNDLTGSATGSIAPWMLDYFVQVNGHLSDLQPLTGTGATNLTTVRDRMYKWIVMKLGQSGVSSEYAFTHAGRYGLTVATTNAGSTWYQTGGQIFQAQTGAANTAVSNTLTGGGGSTPSQAPQGYWGYLLPAIAHAVDHNATGAQTSYNRLIGASNWSSIDTAGFDNRVTFGIKPRNTNQPAWMSSLALNTWYSIPNTSVAAAQVGYPDPGASLPQGAASGKPAIFNWSGGAVAHKKIYLGVGGGHGDYGGNEVPYIDLNVDSPAWALATGFPSTDANMSYTGAARYPDGKPAARHSYWNWHYVPSTNRLMSIGAGALYGPSAGATWQMEGLNLTNHQWDHANGIEYASHGQNYSFQTDMCQCQDGNTGNVFSIVQNNVMFRWNCATNTWSTFGTSYSSNHNGGPSACDTSRDRFVAVSNESVRLYSGLSGSCSESTPNLNGSFVNQVKRYDCTWVYVAYLDLYLVFTHGDSDTNVYSVHPTTWATGIYSVGGTVTKTLNAGVSAFYSRFCHMPELGLICFYGATTSHNLQVFKYRNL